MTFFKNINTKKGRPFQIAPIFPTNLHYYLNNKSPFKIMRGTDT